MPSWLLVVEAEEVDMGKQLVLQPDQTVCIGRSESAEFRVRDKYISRVHAAIVNKGPYSVVVDMGSENGVLVNGNLIDHCVLQDGDIIRLGTAELIYRSDEVKSIVSAARAETAPAEDTGHEADAEQPVQAESSVETESEPEPAETAPAQEAAAEEEPARAEDAFFKQEKKRVHLVPDKAIAKEKEPEEQEEPEEEPAPKIVVKKQTIESRLPRERPGISVPSREELGREKAVEREDFELEVVKQPEPGDEEEADTAPMGAGRLGDSAVDDMLDEAEDPDKTPPSGIYLKESLEGIASDAEGGGKILTAKCEECRLVKKDIFWTPGMRCPRCKSKKFFPVIIMDQEHEYRRADRSSGPAEVDRLLGMIAVWSNLISQKQLERCFKEQKRMARQKRPVPGIDRLLTRMRHCMPEHISALFEVLNFHSLRTGTVQTDEEDFLNRARKSGWITEKQAEFLKSVQEETAVSGRACKPIGYTAIEKGVLSEPRVLALYIKQSENQRGLLYEVRRAIELLGAPLPSRIAHSAIDRPWLGITAAGVLLALLFVNILSASGLGNDWTRRISLIPARTSADRRPCITSEMHGNKSMSEMLYDITLHCPFTGEQADHAVMINHDTGEKRTIKPRKPAEGEDRLQPLRWSEDGTWNVELKLVAPRARGMRNQ